MTDGPALGLLKRRARSVGYEVLPAGIAHRAAGGPVHPGHTYLVGERGRELLHLRTTTAHPAPTMATMASNPRFGLTGLARSAPAAGGGLPAMASPANALASGPAAMAMPAVYANAGPAIDYDRMADALAGKIPRAFEQHNEHHYHGAEMPTEAALDHADRVAGWRLQHLL